MTPPTTLPWPDYPNCPCQCGVTGLKLASRSGHIVKGCECPSCRGRRNRERGQRGEARRHKRLGGSGWTPRDELGNSYSIDISTQDKTGAQIPASFRKFADLEFTRHALSQAERSIPVGSGAFAALYLELAPSDWWIVIRGSGRELRG